MRLMNVLFLLFFLSGTLFPQGEPEVILSEVMFNPASGNNEFIELYNQSETESVNLSAFRIKYYTSNPDSIKDAGFGTVLPPKSYAVIFEGDYGIDTGIYKNLVPPGALILKIKDNSFGTNGMANTTGRILYLIKSEGDTTQLYTYSANNSASFSDEKILISGDNSSANWGNTTKTNGTPGYKNSLSPLLNDIAALSLTTSPPLVISGETVTVFMKLKNRGMNLLSSFTASLWLDSDNDSLPDPAELLYSDEFNNLLSGDTLSIPYEIENLPAGSYGLIMTVTAPADEDTSNNKLFHNFRIASPYNSFNDIVINEIMYAPVSPMPEWIELYNRSNRNINLKNFTLSDSNTKVKITTSDLILLPDSFAVVSKDSSLLNYFPGIRTFLVAGLPAFNNSDDAVVLKDSLGMNIDTLYYFSSWGGGSGGVSLERISPDSSSTAVTNWASSVSPLKSTPGLRNSVAPRINDLSLLRFYPASPYSIAGEGNELFTLIKNTGIGTVSNYALKIYNDLNKDSVAQLNELLITFNGSPLSPLDSVQYNLPLTSVPPGNNIFIALVECPGDEDNSNNKKLSGITGVAVNEVRGDLIINEIMYAPVSPEPEWIEIYNRSGKIISLKNYSVSDSKDTSKVITNNLLISPSEFLVIAKDSNIFLKYNITSKSVVGNIPQLNNDGDKVFLLDSLRRVIDSLEFKNTWGGTSGKSLERKEINSSSPDSAGWGSCISPLSGTPGLANSLSQKSFDIQLLSFWNTPALPVTGDNVSLSARVKNIGLNSVSYALNLYLDTNHDSIPDNLIESAQQLLLQSGDSSDFTFAYQINNINSEKSFVVKAVALQDRDTLNNLLSLTVNPGCLSGSIVINEIMYNPQGGEPEWIELFNRTSDTINFKNWKISDLFTTPGLVTLSESIKILPLSLFVISKDSTILDYHNSIPSGFCIAKLPPLNNDKDGVVLIDASGRVIDSLIYFNTWNTSPGKSLERKNTEDSSASQSNWSGSLDIENSTPGRKNSITPKQYDLALTTFSSIPVNPFFGDTVRLSARIKNLGSQNASFFNILFEIDSDSNNVPDYLLEEQTGLSLNPGDSLLVSSVSGFPNLQKSILASVKVVWELDENQFNNSLQTVISPGYKEKVIVINEIMYNPDSGQPEWIELFNRSTGNLNLRDWWISDYISPSSGKISSADYILNHGEYLVISEDSTLLNSFPSLAGKIKVVNFGALGNSEDGVFIFDSKGTIIDSLIYNNKWGGEKGYSLERLSAEKYSNDSANWTSALGGFKHTAGKENSINHLTSYPRNSLVINEIMYEASTISSEYIEFFNPGSDTLNLGGWTIEDETHNTHRLSDSLFLLSPGEYYLIFADSVMLNIFPQLIGNENKKYSGTSGLGLINSGELILLRDAKGNVIDSLVYSDNWHNRSFTITVDKSLEKISPLLGSNERTNWSTCVNPDGGTPGSVNSIITGNNNNLSKISIEPNPFSPDNDGWEDFALIGYNLSKNISQVTVRIFDDRGREVRNLANNLPAGSSGSIVFDGRDDFGNPLRIGIYLLLLEARDVNNNVFERLKSVVVVARKL